ncbi:bifunctional glutamate N-acetyltransferase/amino-acid acetyltransferase ArgJ [Terriglobus aquaticus]|uniref:Arginine biosynthesis bifunctional protein ArgJ n=1 Tax=Terriglobus aquaticus TaxID=940139 RepID=A0ABW9KIL9_9BACT|nr:bifunctional glutamate N-acetyltransferase/amino-acid acetyltransferase ArgJ [Terriglobus aquaticus]
MATFEQALPAGFRWSAVQAGIKASGRSDLALAVTEEPAAAAAMFTSNQVKAAPLQVDAEHLRASGGYVRAVLVNAGNANCATGEQGLAAARESCAALGRTVGIAPHQVFPSSTGIIGVPLPVEKLIATLPAAVAGLSSGAEAAEAFATAIMTTDTRMKVAQAEVAIGGKPVRIFGCCKGAGMIGPQLVPHATMLVYLFTDLAAQPAELKAMLAPSVEASFNSISVDGDTSTNDTVLLLASGASGAAYGSASQEEQQAFRDALGTVCGKLAHAIIDDGEGVTHVVTLQIKGATDDAAAKRIAKSIAHSPLCKTAWSSADPNWGRIVAAAGYAGVQFDPADVSVHIGGLPVFERGTRSAAMDEAAVHQKMLQREFEIAVSLGSGPGKCQFLTCDLTVEYVHINADYST